MSPARASPLTPSQLYQPPRGLRLRGRHRHDADDQPSRPKSPQFAGHPDVVEGRKTGGGDLSWSREKQRRHFRIRASGGEAVILNGSFNALDSCSSTTRPQPQDSFFLLQLARANAFASTPPAVTRRSACRGLGNLGIRLGTRADRAGVAWSNRGEGGQKRASITWRERESGSRETGEQRQREKQSGRDETEQAVPCPWSRIPLHWVVLWGRRMGTVRGLSESNACSDCLSVLVGGLILHPFSQPPL